MQQLLGAGTGDNLERGSKLLPRILTEDCITGGQSSQSQVKLSLLALKALSNAILQFQQ